MVPRQISEQVLRFLEEYIDSVPQLESLLMMFEEPQRRWSVADISSRTYIPEPEAMKVLERLSRRQLIRPEQDGTHFTIELRDGARQALIEQVKQTYRENLTQIATFIHEKPPASVKEFARAFDLKRGG